MNRIQRVDVLTERFLLVSVTSLLGGIVGGLILAVIGWFHWLGVALSGLTVGIFAWKRISRRLSDYSGGKDYQTATGITAAGILILTGLSVVNPGEHLWAGRDPATYLATAAWLSDSGSLLVDARVGPFAELTDLDYAVNGFYDERPDGRLSPQFFHAFPVLMAAVGQVAGLGGMLVVNAVIGGLGLWAVFVLTSRLTGPLGGLIAVLLLGLNPVFVYFTRSPFTEPLALLFLTTGFWLLIAKEKEDLCLGLVGGALLGAAVMTRVDSLLVLIPLLAFASIGEPPARVWAKPVVRGFLLVGGIGLVEALWISPWYIGQLDVELLMIGLGAVLVMGFSWLPAAMIDRARGWIREKRPTVINVVTGAVVAAVVFGLFVRPHLGAATGAPYDLAPIQEANQLPTEPDRTYAEHSLHWLLWYLGPVALAMGIAGLVLLARRWIEGSVGRGASLWLLAGALSAGAYLWRPSINPDHIWAMRRFLPMVLPGLAIGAAAAFHAIWKRRSRQWRIVAAVAAFAAVAGVGYGYADVWDLHELEGLADDFQSACRIVGPDAAVLLIDTPDATPSSQLMQGFRSYCSIPAAATHIASTSTEQISGLAAQWDEQGRRLVVVGDEQDLGFLDVVPSGILFGSDYPLLEYTLMSRPESLVTVRGSASFGRVLEPDSIGS